MHRWEIWLPAPGIQNHFIKIDFCLTALYSQRAEVACIGSWPHALYLLAPANASDPGCGRLFLPPSNPANPQQSLMLASSPSLSLPSSTEERYLAFYVWSVGRGCGGLEEPQWFGELVFFGC